MKQALNILLEYLTCTDSVMVTKWYNILASFWHKDSGELVKNITSSSETAITITTVDGEGNETETNIEQYKEPENFAIAKINGLNDALENKVDKELGKALSSNDYTIAEKQKLASLTNYVHPETHQIGIIEGLQDIIDDQNQKINHLVGLINNLTGYQYLIWHGYRLYKMGGGLELYPESGDEIQGRGEGQLEGGDLVNLEVINDMPDIDLVVETDYKFLSSY